MTRVTHTLSPNTITDEALSRNLDQYEVVSFDVFDTAVLRTVAEPKDVFLLMERKLIEEYGHTIGADFALKRQTTEVELVERIWVLDRSSEVSLPEIYHALVNNYPELSNLENKLIDLELETERHVTICNPLVMHIFKKAIDAKKKVIFASDIYLPQSHLEKILNDAGYKSFQQLFVSCEINVNKASGSMFPYILDRMEVAPEKVLHFGDSYWSDIRMAKKHGLDARQVPYSLSLLDSDRHLLDKFDRDIGTSLFLGTAKKYTLLNQANEAFNVGFQVLGPLVYSFISWTIEHAAQKKIRHLYFIAREGWFLQKAYDIIAEKRKLDIDSHYLLASRRSLLFPYVEENIAEEILSFALSEKPIKLKDYLESIEVVASAKQLEASGFSDAGQTINPAHNETDHKNLCRLLNAMSTEILEKAKEEKQLYQRYLESIKMTAQAHVGIVDSGWFGTGHSRIARFLESANPKAELSGFYFALHKSSEKRFTDTSKGYGYLYQFDTLGNNIEDFNELAKIIEVLLSAPTESFKRFREVDKELVPVYVKDNGALEQDPIIHDIQEGALAFIKEHLEIDPTGEFPPARNYVKTFFTHFIKHPTMNEALQIGSLPYEADMIKDKDSVIMFANPNKSTFQLLADPITTLREFNASSWRAAHFKNIKSPAVRLYLKMTSRYFLQHTLLFKVLKKLKNRLLN